MNKDWDDFLDFLRASVEEIYSVQLKSKTGNMIINKVTDVTLKKQIVVFEAKDLSSIKILRSDFRGFSFDSFSCTIYCKNATIAIDLGV